MQLGQELTRRIDNDPSESNNIDKDSDYDDDHNDGEKLYSILNDNEQAPEIDGKFKKLFDMQFMKNAKETRQLKAKEEARAILKELSAIDNDSGEESFDEESNNKKKMVLKDKKVKVKIAKENLKSILHSNGSMSIKPSKLNIDGFSEPNTSSSVEGEINPWILPDSSALTTRNKESKNHNKLFISSEPTDKITFSNVKASESQILSSKKSTSDKSTINSNNNVTSKSSKSKGNKLIDPKNTNLLEKNMKVGNHDLVNTTETKNSSHSHQVERKPFLLQKSQEDLVQMAFSGPDLEEEYSKMKDKAVEEELGIDAKKAKILSQGI